MDFVKLIQSLQELVFEIVVWVLLLPKTFFRALVRPDLMVKYVNTELQKEPEKQFDDFISPVLFYLMLAVIPAALYTWMGDGITQQGESFFGLTENNVWMSVLTTLISLLIYLVWIEGLNRRPLRRSGLRRLFFIQCYLVTPAQLIYTLLLTAGFGSMNPAILGLLGTLVLISYEAFAFSDELKVNLVKGLGYAALPQLALFVALLIAASLFS
jgi:hypothetical protein